MVILISKSYLYGLYLILFYKIFITLKIIYDCKMIKWFSNHTEVFNEKQIKCFIINDLVIMNTNDVIDVNIFCLTFIYD